MALLPSRAQLSTDDVPGAPAWIQPLLERINGFTGPVYDALSRGLTFAENFSGEVVDVVVTPPDDWSPVTFGAGWTQWVDANYAPCALHKDEDGFVTARGLVDNTGPGDYLITFDPSGPYAPAPGEWLIVPSNANMEFGSLLVQTPGIMYNSGRKDAWTSLASVRWRAADRNPLRWPRPLSVDLGQQGRLFPGKPGVVLPLSVKRSDGRPTSAVVTSLGWEPVLLDRKAGTAGIRINRLSGLTPGVQYRVKLLVLPE